jgi:hypothetical protein
MTKKDYIKIADILADNRPLNTLDNDYNNLFKQWKTTTEQFIDMLSRDNPRFNRVKFYEYINKKTS